MISVDQEHLTADIAHAFIAQVAPQELVVFQGISEAYLRDPDRSIEKPTGKEDLLGFGGGEVVVVITPVVLTILTNVLSSFIHEAMKVHVPGHRVRPSILLQQLSLEASKQQAQSIARRWHPLT